MKNVLKMLLAKMLNVNVKRIEITLKDSLANTKRRLLMQPEAMAEAARAAVGDEESEIDITISDPDPTDPSASKEADADTAIRTIQSKSVPELNEALNNPAVRAVLGEGKSLEVISNAKSGAAAHGVSLAGAFLVAAAFVVR